jgi:hypothetical protein
MVAIRAEVPGIAVEFASIGLCHGVFLLSLEGSGLTSEPWVENTMGRREKLKKH